MLPGAPVPGLSVLIYDILLTTTREITHVWLAPKTLFNILYLFQRYLPFIDVLLIGVPRKLFLPC
jgi:hypothetical protein